jgi:DegV family protein with EDD domain
LQKFDIRVVPAFVNFGETSYPDDGVSLPRPQFYERLAAATVLPTTSAPPPGLGEQVFREALAQADHVVAFAVSANLSGIYNGMVVAAREVDVNRITVIDSGTLTMSQGWMAIAAAEAAERGASVAEIQALVDDMRPRTNLYAVLDTLEYLRRSGRVSWLTASFGAVLQIKPIIILQSGEVSTTGRVRTFDKATQAIAQIAHDHAPLERLAVLHSNAPDRAQKLLDLLQDIAPKDYLAVVDVTTVIGTHVGPGGIGLALVQAKA